MSLHYEDAGLRLWHGSNRDILPTFADATFDSIVTDPPYELGFMGKGWDSSGIAYDVDVWRDCLRVLKPGGHLLAFGGSRTWHRVAVAIEDAGFEIRDSIAWLYGSGFPKSLDVAKAIDKLDAAHERTARAREFQAWLRDYLTPQRVNEITGTQMGYLLTTHPTQPAVATPGVFDMLRPYLPPVPERIEALVADRVVESENFAKRPPADYAGGVGMADSWADGKGWSGKASRGGSAITPEAALWEGWGTALKPAFEPIIVARKSITGTIARTVLTHGTGALNIAATRIEGRERTDYGLANAKRTKGATFGDPSESADFDASLGRWPTNVLVDESQAEELGAEARFFPTFRYEAKAPSSERPEVDGTVHATVKPLELMRWLVRLVTRRGGRVLDLYAGSGTTGEAALLEGCEVDLIELESDHLPLILQRVRKPLQPSMFGDWEAIA